MKPTLYIEKSHIYIKLSLQAVIATISDRFISHCSTTTQTLSSSFPLVIDSLIKAKIPIFLNRLSATYCFRFI